MVEQNPNKLNLILKFFLILADTKVHLNRFLHFMYVEQNKIDIVKTVVIKFKAHIDCLHKNCIEKVFKTIELFSFGVKGYINCNVMCVK